MVHLSGFLLSSGFSGKFSGCFKSATSTAGAAIRRIIYLLAFIAIACVVIPATTILGGLERSYWSQDAPDYAPIRHFLADSHGRCMLLHECLLFPSRQFPEQSVNAVSPSQLRGLQLRVTHVPPLHGHPRVCSRPPILI